MIFTIAWQFTFRRPGRSPACPLLRPRWTPARRWPCAARRARGAQGADILNDAAQLGHDVPDQDQNRSKHLIPEGQLQGRDVGEDQADHPVQDGSHQDGHHGPQLVPQAVPGHLGRPLPRPQGGRGAGAVVQQHTNHPGHHQPAKPAPQGGQAAHHGGNGRLESVDMLHMYLPYSSSPALRSIWRFTRLSSVRCSAPLWLPWSTPQSTALCTVSRAHSGHSSTLV